MGGGDFQLLRRRNNLVGSRLLTFVQFGKFAVLNITVGFTSHFKLVAAGGRWGWSKSSVGIEPDRMFTGAELWD
jgi:hypothetical protein